MTLVNAIPALKWIWESITAKALLSERDKEIKRLRSRIRKMEKTIK
jgi:hypothetical protein